MAPRGAPESTLGLYVHVPFCVRACPYCDFDFVVGRSIDVDGYLAGLQREWSLRLAELPERPPVRTIYVGGGTPSALGAAGLAALLDWISGAVDTSRAQEVTVELNPEHVDLALLAALRDGGVGRVSLGLQSTDRGGLVQLGRAHDAERGLAALRACIGHGFETSADLIVGWPGQTQEQVARDVHAVADVGVHHVSVYALSIEPDTPWVSLVQRGTRSMPDDDAQALALRTAESALVEAGFEHYEVAGYARPGRRAKHNVGYWTWLDYVGLGPSAASATYAASGAVARRTNRRGLHAWLGDPGVAEVERLEAVPAAIEGIFVGLRQIAGLDVEGFLARFACVDRDWLQRRVAREIDRGNLEWSSGASSVRVPGDRWLWLDEICAALM